MKLRDRQLLIATPTMSDNIFSGTVCYLLDHTKHGSLGVIINRPLIDLSLGRLFEEMEITDHAPGTENIPIMFGGPVHRERGFIFHSPERKWASTVQLAKELSLTVSKDIIQDIAKGQGPQRYLIVLGCAGWSSGQLADEIKRDAWIVSPAFAEIFFEVPFEDRLSRAMRFMGLHDRIIGHAGHA